MLHSAPPAVIISETTLSLPEAAKRIPPYRKGIPVTVNCLMRYILKGVKTPHGVLRLEAARIGGRWFTSAEALQRFVAAQTPDLTGQPQAPRTRSAAQRASAHHGAQLEAAGW